MIAARDELTPRQAPRPERWTWGRLHRHRTCATRPSGESGIAPVERLFNRDGWQVGGGSAIVDATSWDAAEGYDVTAAPSMRMVVSLADFDDSRWINLTGVSGHPASSHYTDQTELWRRRRDPALGLQPRGRRGGGRGPAGADAGGLTSEGALRQDHDPAPVNA